MRQERRRHYYSTHRQRENPGEALYGWSQIAEHMGSTAQTVQRWDRRFGMPVVRHVAKRVFTTRTAIDAWIRDLSSAERRIVTKMKNDGQNGEGEYRAQEETNATEALLRHPS